jgi:uncharacterized protein YecT (DUF1311 family)
MEMNACAALDFERADAELNIAYRAAIAGQRAGDREIDRSYDTRATGEAKLREAQRAWSVFRSMEPMIYEGCRARLTRERTTQLRPQPTPDQ